MKLAHFLHLFLLLKTIDDHIFLPIIVYDILTGKIKATLKGHKGCVRDVSWHPYLNEIISSSVSIYLIAITCFNFIEFKIIINIINFFLTVYIFKICKVCFVSVIFTIFSFLIKINFSGMELLLNGRMVGQNWTLIQMTWEVFIHLAEKTLVQVLVLQVLVDRVV